MARIRTIKPTFFLDGKIGRKPPILRLFFIGLWCLADREGRLEEDHDLIKLQVIPYDKISVEKCLQDLCPDFLIRYQIGQKTYIQIKNFAKHQKPHPKEAQSDVPTPSSSEAVELHGKPLNIPASKVELGREGVSVNGNGDGARTPVPGHTHKVFQKPTADEVTAYAKSIGYQLSGAGFVNKYESIGWLVGKNRTPMKDWRAVVRTWKDHEAKSRSQEIPAYWKPLEESKT